MLDKSIDKRDQYEMISILELVPSNHLLRRVDNILDLNFIYELVEDKYCLDNGRPSINMDSLSMSFCSISWVL
ncbi:hypothetical protein ABLV94_00825 [Staphylococcus sp. Mo2-7]|uniref:hypothetical protein n=1 Tax=Staphylococcus sp. Mo2-6 TaxID=3135641 RepID=UPI0033693596